LCVKHQAVYFTSGSRGWGDFYSDEGDLFLQSGDLTNNCTISLTNAKRVKLPRKAEGLRTRLQTNDTVVCITGANTGRVANVGEISETIYVNQHLCLVRPSKVIDHRYLSLALSGSAGRTHFSLCQYGLKEGLSLDDVKNCAFPVPPLFEQGEILGFIDRISSAIEASKNSVSRQIQSLKSLRSTLIAHAVTGKIAIPAQNS
jgi:type I restriction enzyme S subunit